MSNRNETYCVHAARPGAYQTDCGRDQGTVLVANYPHDVTCEVCLRAYRAAERRRAERKNR